MSKISQKGLEKAIKNYLMTLEPVAKNVSKKSTSFVTADGAVVIKEEKGDLYIEEQPAASFAMAVARGVHEHVAQYVHETVVGKLNELTQQYNQLRQDVIDAAIPVSAQEVSEIPTS